MKYEAIYAGEEFQFGKDTYTLAPLNFFFMRKNQAKLADFSAQKMSEDQIFDFTVEIVLASLKRNYPEMTQDFVEQNLDMGNVQKVMPAVLGQSGFVKATGEVSQKGQEEKK